MCCKFGSGVGTTIGERCNVLFVWTWGDLFGVREGVGVGSETRGIEIRGHVIMAGKVDDVDGTNLGDGTRDGRAM